MAIHSLRPEFRPDNARNQVRASQTLARRLYLFGLSGGALWVAYLFVGSLVLMDASGLVVQEREIITQPFDAQVLSFTARPGEKIAAGQKLGSVVSTQMLDLISSLVTRKAQLEFAPDPDHRAARRHPDDPALGGKPQPHGESGAGGDRKSGGGRLFHAGAPRRGDPRRL